MDPNVININMQKWKDKVQADDISLNQVSKCFKNLTSKFLQNDYLDYKSQMQYILHEVQSILNASNCILATNRPPNATKIELSDCKITDLIWIICHKNFLKTSIKKENVDI